MLTIIFLSIDLILELYQIFSFMTIAKEKAISQGYSLFVYIEDLSNNQKKSVLPITKII